MTNQDKLQEYKLKKGWWFSIFFLFLVILLVLFLAFVDIVDKNRDVLVGILGVITGSISSMIAIASGRDPSEVEELKDKLGKANADREALIARLRDAQIQMQLLREQINSLQLAIIENLTSLSKIKEVNQENIKLNETVERYLPKKGSKE